MKWIAISGSWRKMSEQLEGDVRANVRAILERGDGIVSGGALGVDYVATDEALKFDPTAEKLKIFLPATLEIYAAHYRKRAEEGVITERQAEDLIVQLARVKKANPQAMKETQDIVVIDRERYYGRNSEIVSAADELVAFHVNKSLGTNDAIEKARQAGKPTKVFEYEIE